MDPWYGKGAFLAGTVAMAIVRAPHIRRSVKVPVARQRHRGREAALVGFVTLGLVVQVVWVATPLLAFADYPLEPGPFGAGLLAFALGLWFLHRSHVDLGRNWSNTLEVREQHALVVHGIYRRIRHPMYLALLLYSVGQALTMPNWVAGPAFGVAFLLLVAVRLPSEERMMREEFGGAYEAYAAGTKRILPGVW
jgi:protein-S-isoprenylcysteine O-methyltransferase Ste14